MRLGVAVLLLCSLAGCRGKAPAATAATPLGVLVDSLRPSVEAATGLRFTEPLTSAVVSKAAVRDYLAGQLERELPARRREGLLGAYRLLGLLPDSLDLEALILRLYTEQVAGYYDYDTRTLYGVEGADPAQLRLVMAHEMVHALQGQHLPLDRMMRDSASDNDRKTARQAVLEGQATLASILVLAPGRDLVADDSFWELYREQIASAQEKMPAFAAAPAVLRTGLIFPYLNGAEFMRWWLQRHGTDSMPYGAAMPVSSEQILTPARLASGDQPLNVRFGAVPMPGELLLEDVFGELELRLLADERAGLTTMDRAVALGWGGDRYRVWRTPDGPALELVIVWDDARAAQFYAPVLDRVIAPLPAGRRGTLTAFQLNGKPASRVLIGPKGWAGFDVAVDVQLR